jgi:preprotein translocase subunit SecE
MDGSFQGRLGACVHLSHCDYANVWDEKPMADPFKYVQEVRQEVSKVTWPTWKEVWITTVMVLIMVTLAAIFFLFADFVFQHLMQSILGLGR